MSTLDQPLLIANVNYHVGHWVAIYVAEEQGFFKQEGLSRYEYERSGLLPAVRAFIDYLVQELPPLMGEVTGVTCNESAGA